MLNLHRGKTRNIDDFIDKVSDEKKLDWAGYQLSHFHTEKLRSNCRRYIRAMKMPKWNTPEMAEKLRNLMVKSMVEAIDEFYALHTTPSSQEFKRF